MKTFSFLFAVAFVGVCLGAETVPTQQSKEPNYKGKTLSDWIALTKDKDKNVQCDAAEAIGKIRPEARIAMPPLTELLKDQDAEVRCAAVSALGGIGSEAIPVITEALKDKNARVRWAAAVAVRDIGTDRALSDFLELLEDEKRDGQSASRFRKTWVRMSKRPSPPS